MGEGWRPWRYGPSVATCLTGTPVLTDMKPRTEKMTKPPKMLVAQLMSDTITESLCSHTTTHIARLKARLVGTVSLYTPRGAQCRRALPAEMHFLHSYTAEITAPTANDATFTNFASKLFCFSYTVNGTTIVKILHCKIF